METSDNSNNSFFKSLREGISSINKNVSEVEKEMKVPVLEHSEDKALIKLVNMSNEVKQMKTSAMQMDKDLEESNRRNYQYFNHMESLVQSMEKRLENVVNYLKDFGYTPNTKEEEPVPDLNQNTTNTESTSELSNCNENEISSKNNVKTSDECENTDILMKTPICLSTKTYHSFNKITGNGQRLFPPALKSCDTTGASSHETNFDEYSIISGENPSAHVENLSFDMKPLDAEITKISGGCSPQEPMLTSSKKTRQLETQRVITPENPLLTFCNKEKMITPEDTVFSVYKDDAPQTPKTPEVKSSKFQRS